MADRPTDPTAPGQPYNRGREDTVVRPLPPPPTPPAEAESASNGSNGQAAAPPVNAPTKPTPRPRTAKAPATTAANPVARTAKPPAPPPQARPVAASAPAVAQPTPVVVPPPTAPDPDPVARQHDGAQVAPSPAPVAQPARQQPAKPTKPAKPTRAERRARKDAPAPKPGRRARLRVTRVDPWSVMKTSFLLSIALAIVTVVSVLMVWSVLGAADVWTSINNTVQDVVGGEETSNFDIEDYLGTRRVVGFTMIVAAVDVVLLTAICTLGAFLYNMSASLLGGIEVTLAEDN